VSRRPVDIIANHIRLHTLDRNSTPAGKWAEQIVKRLEREGFRIVRADDTTEMVEIESWLEVES